MSIPSYAGAFLFVDLSKEKVYKKPLRVDFARKYLGGKGFGAKILFDSTKPQIDPLAPENLLMYMTGPLTGTLAPSNRYCTVTKSPLTGTFCDSYAGGHFGQELKFAGYDGLIVMGKSKEPCYIWIDDDDIKIKPANHIWRLDTYETYRAIKEELGDESVKISCIGPAGENLVRFALIDCDFHRQSGRGGTGAVMGSKKLKAIALRGTKGITVADLEAFVNAVHEAYDALNESEDVQEYRSYGTPGFVLFSNELGFYPTRNFQDGVFEKAEALSAEAQSKRLWIREVGCFACPIHCSRICVIRRGSHAGTICDIVEYETTAFLGSNLGIDNLEEVAYNGLLCDKLGIDTISLGNILGFAMECYQKGLITKKDTNGIELEFGNPKSVTELIKKIAYREGIGNILAEGTMRAAKKIGKGAKKYAVHIKGLECPGWDPRGAPGFGLGLATADRGGCHMRGWTIGYETSGSGPKGQPLEQMSTHGKAEVVIWENDYTSVIYSLVLCDFTRGIKRGMTPKLFAKLLSTATGWNVNEDDLMKYGERTWNLARCFNVREGFTRKDDKLPTKFKEPLPSGPTRGHMFQDEVFNKMLDDYYTRRGWTKGGIPTKKKLIELGLEDELNILYK